jgi:hypothetical protein
VNPDGVFLNESTPVSDEGLAEVHGTGTPTPPLPRDVAIILWDEQPKVKPGPATPTGGGNPPHSVRASVIVR